MADATGMTKTLTYRDATALRAPRPFLHLTPAQLPIPADAIGPADIAELRAVVNERLPQLSRSLVNFTIARQNAHAPWPQPIQVSVLNRRRRAARCWLLAIMVGGVDAGTQRLVATQWLPVLCGTGPDRAGIEPMARSLVEFLRGTITGCIFDEASESLLPQARALHALETTLAVHLAAVTDGWQ